MIISKIPKRLNSRWLIACTLLCAIFILPLSLAHAQDCDAVGKRLRKAVRKGELTKEQAAIMMEALKKGATKTAKKVGPPVKKVGTPVKKSNPDADLEAVRQKLLAMVKDGQLTKEEAATKMATIKKGTSHKKVTKTKAADPDYKALGMELEAAVKAGKLTKEEAKAKWEAIKKDVAKKKSSKAKKTKDTSNLDQEALAKELKAAIKAGKLTEEEAKVRMAAAKKKAYAGDKIKD